nr:Com family DNA-binding transcriptional regulator [Pseudomonas capsici]
MLARMGEYTELQIKCSRCGTLNHVKATSLESSPLSVPNNPQQGQPSTS